jgi:hypothetical protein
MSSVAPEAAGGDQDREGVRGLQDQQAAGSQCAEGQAHEAVEGGGRQVLDDVEGDHASQAPRRHRRQPLQQVSDLGLEAPLPAAGHHLGARVDAAGLETRLTEDGQGLPPAASEVEDRPQAGHRAQALGVDPQAPADLLLAPPKAPLEGEIGLLVPDPGEGAGLRPCLRTPPKLPRSRLGVQGRQGAAQSPQEVLDLPAVAVEALVDAGEEGVVVAQQVAQGPGDEVLQVADPLVVAARLQISQVPEEDLVEHPLAVP